MRKWLLALLFAAMLTLAACGGDDSDTEEPADEGTDTEESAETEDDAAGETDDAAGETADSSAGDDIYQANCASCHGGDLSGGVGPDLTTVGDNLSAADIETIIHEGQGTMPAIPLSDDEAASVAQWLVEQ